MWKFLKTQKTLLMKIGVNASLRYAIRLIMSSALAFQKQKGKIVQMEDVSGVYKLFMDVKGSTQYLVEYQSEYMFSELKEAIADEAKADAISYWISIDQCQILILWHHRGRH